MQTEKVSASMLVDIYENDHEILLVADVPGVSADKVDARLEHGTLRVSAERETGGVVYERTFRVRTPIDAAGVHAKIKDGVLSLHLPKTEAAKGKQIPVASS